MMIRAVVGKTWKKLKNAKEQRQLRITLHRTEGYDKSHVLTALTLVDLGPRRQVP